MNSLQDAVCKWDSLCMDADQLHRKIQTIVEEMELARTAIFENAMAPRFGEAPIAVVLTNNCNRHTVFILNPPSQEGTNIIHRYMDQAPERDPEPQPPIEPPNEEIRELDVSPPIESWGRPPLY